MLYRPSFGWEVIGPSVRTWAPATVSWFYSWTIQIDSITNDINSVNNGVVPIHASVDFGCETDFFFRIEIFLDDVDHTVPVRTGESPVKEEPSSAWNGGNQRPDGGPLPPPSPRASLAAHRRWFPLCGRPMAEKQAPKKIRWKVLRLWQLLPKFWQVRNKCDSPSTVNRPITKANRRVILLKPKWNRRRQKRRGGARVKFCVNCLLRSSQPSTDWSATTRSGCSSWGGWGGSRIGTALTHQKVEKLEGSTLWAFGGWSACSFFEELQPIKVQGVVVAQSFPSRRINEKWMKKKRIKGASTATARRRLLPVGAVR